MSLPSWGWPFENFENTSADEALPVGDRYSLEGFLLITGNGFSNLPLALPGVMLFVSKFASLKPSDSLKKFCNL